MENFFADDLQLSFPIDEAVKKPVYLAINEIEKKWTIPIKTGL